jgi:DNA-binding transcriptional ArsR family regulator
MSATIDFKAVSPFAQVNADQPEALFTAVSQLPHWDPRSLGKTDGLLIEWVSDYLARPRDREGWAELLGVIQRIEVIQAPEKQPEALHEAVSATYRRWDAMSDLLAARIDREDLHNSHEVAQRTHMVRLQNALNGQERRSSDVRQELGISPSRLSQLLSLAEAAGLIERRKEGRESLVSAAGIWKQENKTADQAPAEPHLSFSRSAFGTNKKAA